MKATSDNILPIISNTTAIELFETLLNNFQQAFPNDVKARWDLVDEIMAYGNKCRTEGIEIGIYDQQMKGLK